MKRCCKSPVDALKYFRLMENKLDGIPVTISRAGYTGDLGYEIWRMRRMRWQSGMR